MIPVALMALVFEVFRWAYPMAKKAKEEFETPHITAYADDKSFTEGTPNVTTDGVCDDSPADGLRGDEPTQQG